jgi:uncharacterized protein YebE (UPF0316 family)
MVLFASFLPEWLTLPLLIFVAELCVVTISTIRIIFVSRGRKVLAPILGFFEITIWLFAIGQIMQNLSNLSCYAAFAGGFTLGNYFGVLIENRLAIGNVVINIVTRRDAQMLVAELRIADYGVTSMDALGGTGPVQIVFSVIKRKDLAKVLGILKRFDPRAFYAVHDVQAATTGIYPTTRSRWQGILPLARRSADEAGRAEPVAA